MNQGIYIILNTENGKFYLGSAVNIHARWNHHRGQLRRGVHENRHLQSAWTKYGEAAFHFEIVEFVEDRLWLLIREQLWLNETRCWETGYNLSKEATGFNGEEVRLRLKGKPWTAQRRTAEATADRSYITREFRIGVSQRKNPMSGKHHSEAVKIMAAYHGTVGGHRRHHLNRGLVNPTCELCRGAV
jgi:group I intron endonuclease